MATEYISTETGCQYLRKYKIEDGTSFLYDEGFNDGIETAISCIGNEVPAADVVDVVRCKDCIHAPLPGDCEGNDMEWPKIDGIYEDCTCPHCCADNWYSTRPDPDGFCEKGERRESNLDTTKGDNHD